jgi:hypothetical protein
MGKDERMEVESFALGIKPCSILKLGPVRHGTLPPRYSAKMDQPPRTTSN